MSRTPLQLAEQLAAMSYTDVKAAAEQITAAAAALELELKQELTARKKSDLEQLITSGAFEAFEAAGKLEEMFKAIELEQTLTATPIDVPPTVELPARVESGGGASIEADELPEQLEKLEADELPARVVEARTANAEDQIVKILSPVLALNIHNGDLVINPNLTALGLVSFAQVSLTQAQAAAAAGARVLAQYSKTPEVTING